MRAAVALLLALAVPCSGMRQVTAVDLAPQLVEAAARGGQGRDALVGGEVAQRAPEDEAESPTYDGKPTFNYTTARQFLEYAIIFCDKAERVEWDCGAHCKNKVVSQKSTTLFGGYGKSGVVGYVARLQPRKSRRCVLSFRGTVNTKNRIADVKAVWKPWPPPDQHRLAEACVGCMVHKGFADAYAELHLEMFDAIKTAGCRRIELTGHSLGGALVTLAAMELRAKQLDGEALEVGDLWTFGSPRVGNMAFAQAFVNVSAQLGSQPSWRVVHYHDPVPLVPSGTRQKPYQHVPGLVYYSSRKGREFAVCPWKNASAAYHEEFGCGTHREDKTGFTGAMLISEGLKGGDHIWYLGKDLARPRANCPKSRKEVNVKAA